LTPFNAPLLFAVLFCAQINDIFAKLTARCPRFRHSVSLFPLPVRTAVCVTLFVFPRAPILTRFWLPLLLPLCCRVRQHRREPNWLSTVVKSEDRRGVFAGIPGPALVSTRSALELTSLISSPATTGYFQIFQVSLRFFGCVFFERSFDFVFFFFFFFCFSLCFWSPSADD